MNSSRFTKSKIKSIQGIVYRNVFPLVNRIIFFVVILLSIFGDIQEGLFLGLVTVINIIIGIVQETRALIILDNLQLLSAPKITKVSDDEGEIIIPIEQIKINDKIKLKIGDQVPCDGHLINSHSFEVSESLISGESKTFFRKTGDAVLAGSIITSGTGILLADKSYAESRIAKMTESIKSYSLSQSPIQQSLTTIIKITGYLLLVIIAFVGIRGYLIHEPTLNIIQNIGALTSALLPQGMLIITTLLFAYGASNLYHHNILLQEINSIEKISRIKNLCIDKTGTLTDNNLIVRNIYSPPKINKVIAKDLCLAYIKGTDEQSQTMQAIKNSLDGTYEGDILEYISFSSTRQFGAVRIANTKNDNIVLAGAPDIFLPYFKNNTDKIWLEQFINSEGKKGKRIVCFVSAKSKILPQTLSKIKLSVICIYVLENNLREGIIDAINYFHTRDVRIRIISGDNLETVQAVATLANIKSINNAITGPELENWSELNYIENAPKYSIFARVKPEQKEKIIKALKFDGYTAMIGDGANDVLAMKSADMSIAIFDGSQATRQIASMILTKNSFADLPNGVKLSETIIENIEIYASVFFNQVFLAFFFFVMLTLLGYSFPFTPLNMTFIGYFTIGLPGFLIFYWIMKPIHINILKKEGSFLRRVIPFALVSAIPSSLVAIYAFNSTLQQTENTEPTGLVVILFIILGVLFFMTSPSVYSGPISKTQKVEFILLIFAEFFSVYILISLPVLAEFYDINKTSLKSFLEIVPLVILCGVIQYIIAKQFFIGKLSNSTN